MSGTFDLALSRADHDMWFGEIEVPLVGRSAWDGSDSLWDDGASLWDLDLSATLRRYTLVAIDGADKVAQQIKINLLTFFGEWFLDVTWGVPYLEDILVKNPQLSAIEVILRSHINSVPHVIRLETFQMLFDRANRTLQVNFVAQTDYGRIQDSVKLDTAFHV